MLRRSCRACNHRPSAGASAVPARGAASAKTPLRFGGRVYASTLLNFIEELPYVDYVTDFKLLTEDEAGTLAPVDHADPLTPDAMLVSDASHDIGEVLP